MDFDEDLKDNQRFLRETERSIRISNNEVMHQLVAPVTTERMLSFSVAVSKLRAQYIMAAFKFADAKHPAGAEGNAEIDELTLARKRFEEARDAFAALERTIELGYISVK